MSRLGKEKDNRHQSSKRNYDNDMDNMNPERSSQIDQGRIQTGRELKRNERRYAADREFGGPLTQRKLSGDYSGYNPMGELGEGIGEQGFSSSGYDRSFYHQVEGKHFGKGPRGWRRSDEMIREEACESLYRDSHVDASNIDVTVKDACVYLRGTVEDRQEKRRAEECVERVSGVEDVQNELRLSKSSISQPQFDRRSNQRTHDSNQTNLS